MEVAFVSVKPHSHAHDFRFGFMRVNGPWGVQYQAL